uniref:Uncharacterized protein n=1 Tax=Myoviridae sp. ct1IL4 TaxID=2825019 RepID=A0A8S5Q8S7_9CAUD|nr:MAG TPA: hypothetical protein [Myoviridae sp. ct1IL4]
MTSDITPNNAFFIVWWEIDVIIRVIGLII